MIIREVALRQNEPEEILARFGSILKKNLLRKMFSKPFFRAFYSNF